MTHQHLPYLIVEVDPETAIALEHTGAKRKYWFRPPTEPEGQSLFKADERIAGKRVERGTGEDWAEKVACEVCEALGIPHVHYELAIEKGSQIHGVLCHNIAQNPPELLLGNVLLSSAVQGYPRVPAKKHRTHQHAVAAVVRVLNELEMPPDHFCDNLPLGVDTALDVFIGYTMLDALVANQDRHHENWGALRYPTRDCLAPTFDHGSALARNEPDQKREWRLDKIDPRATVESFAEKAKSAFYVAASPQSPLCTLEAFRHFAVESPNAAIAWQNRLESLTIGVVESIVDRIPASRMSPIARRFTIELVRINRQRILETSFQQ